MKCPQCGHQQKDFLTACMLCGLVFAKASKPAQTKPSAPTHTPKADKAEGGQPGGVAGKMKGLLGRLGKGASKGPVVNREGQLDIAATIMRQAERVDTRELVETDSEVLALDMAVVVQLIHQAVDEVLARQGGFNSQAHREELLKGAEEEFQKKLAAFQTEKETVEQKIAKLQSDLENSRAALAEEKSKDVDSTSFTLSSDAMKELSGSFEMMLQRIVAAGSVTPAFEEELRRIVNHVLDDERRRILEKERENQSDAVLLLQNKIDRLSRSLHEAESERDKAKRLAAALEAGGSVPGLVFTGSDFSVNNEENQLRMELMKEISRQNEELRQQLLKEGKQVAFREKPAPAPLVNAVQAITDYKDFAPPPLERNK
ncbi:MAG: hypothetical protein AB7F75_04400 [Planctomycetota bacterium]